MQVFFKFEVLMKDFFSHILLKFEHFEKKYSPSNLALLSFDEFVRGFFTNLDLIIPKIISKIKKIKMSNHNIYHNSVLSAGAAECASSRNNSAMFLSSYGRPNEGHRFLSTIKR